MPRTHNPGRGCCQPHWTDGQIEAQRDGRLRKATGFRRSRTRQCAPPRVRVSDRLLTDAAASLSVCKHAMTAAAAHLHSEGRTLPGFAQRSSHTAACKPGVVPILQRRTLRPREGKGQSNPRAFASQELANGIKPCSHGLPPNRVQYFPISSFSRKARFHSNSVLCCHSVGPLQLVASLPGLPSLYWVTPGSQTPAARQNLMS